MSVKRYGIKHLNNHVMPFIGEIEEGEYVKYKDYQIVETQMIMFKGGASAMRKKSEELAQDRLDKVQSLWGYLKIWQRGNPKPPELDELLDEVEEFILEDTGIEEKK